MTRNGARYGIWTLKTDPSLLPFDEAFDAVDPVELAWYFSLEEEDPSDEAEAEDDEAGLLPMRGACEGIVPELGMVFLSIALLYYSTELHLLRFCFHSHFSGGSNGKLSIV